MERKYKNITLDELTKTDEALKKMKDDLDKERKNGNLSESNLNMTVHYYNLRLRAYERAKRQFDENLLKSNNVDNTDLLISDEEIKTLVKSVNFNITLSRTLGEVLVISGPSGVGKDTVIKILLENHPEILKAGFCYN